jgi:3-oxoadipate enol-lactonase
MQIVADNFAGSLEAKLAWPTSSAYEDISAHLEDIAVPTLVVAGEQDRQDSLEQHQREVLRRIPAAKLHVIRDCGHLVPNRSARPACPYHQDLHCGHQLSFQTKRIASVE